MSEQEIAVGSARSEFAYYGCLSIGTTTRLTGLGLIVEDLISEFEQEKD